jgi:macrolide transport system ATP-binding/permease protein
VQLQYGLGALCGQALQRHSQRGERARRQRRFFPTLQAKLKRGRYFTDADDASKPKVIMINEAFAQKYFPGEDPIGKKIGDTNLTPKSIREIVGVVADFKDADSIRSNGRPSTRHFNQNRTPTFLVACAHAQDEQRCCRLAAKAIHEVNPEAAWKKARHHDAAHHDSQTAYLHRSAAYLVGGFAAWRWCWAWWGCTG